MRIGGCGSVSAQPGEVGLGVEAVEFAETTSEKMFAAAYWAPTGSHRTRGAPRSAHPSARVPVLVVISS